MKRALYLFVMLIPVLLSAQAGTLGLDVVWQKEIPGLDVSQAKFSADGRYLYLAVGTEIRKMSVETGEVVSTFDNTGLPSIAELYHMNVSSLGNYVYANNGNGEICIWDTKTERPYKTILFGERGKDSTANCVIMTPDEKYLLICMAIKDGSDNHPNYVTVYDLETEVQITKIYVQGHIDLIQLSHDGKHFVTGTSYKNYMNEYYNRLVLWSTDSMKQVAVLEDVKATYSGYSKLCFSPDDKYLGCNREEPINGSYYAAIFNLSSNKMIINSDIERQCNNVVFLPDNQHFLFNYFTWGGDHDLELHSYTEMIKNYKYAVGIIETYDSNGVWKIFACRIPNFMMLTNTTSAVFENPDNDVTLNIVDNNILVSFTNSVIVPIVITIYDLIGNTVHQETINELSIGSTYQVNAELPSGLYISKIQSGEKNYNFKFEIVR